MSTPLEQAIEQIKSDLSIILDKIDLLLHNNYYINYFSQLEHIKIITLELLSKEENNWLKLEKKTTYAKKILTDVVNKQLENNVNNLGEEFNKLTLLLDK